MLINCVRHSGGSRDGGSILCSGPGTSSLKIWSLNCILEVDQIDGIEEGVGQNPQAKVQKMQKLGVGP